MNVGFRPGCDETAVWRRARGAGTGGVAVKFFIAFDTKRKRRASRIFSKNIGFCLNSPQEETFKQREIFFCGSAREISYKICVSVQNCTDGKIIQLGKLPGCYFFGEEKGLPFGEFFLLFFLAAGDGVRFAIAVASLLA